jgi:anti-anti-sigma factor
MSEMAMTVERAERGPRVVLAGELDLASGDALEALVTPMVEERGAHVEIGLRDVDFVDSSGLGALLALSQLAEDSGAQLVLLAPSDAVTSALNLTHTAEMFTVEAQV